MHCYKCKDCAMIVGVTMSPQKKQLGNYMRNNRKMYSSDNKIWQLVRHKIRKK